MSIRPWGLFVIRRLDFARVDPDGISAGMDLDGRVSDGSEAATCFKSDLVDPDGVPGIDNEFSAILPTVEAIPGVDLAQDFREAIGTGEILLLLDIEQTAEGGARVSFLVGQPAAADAPALDAGGLLLADQVFDLRPLSSATVGEVMPVSAACEAESRMTTAALDLPLPWPQRDLPTVEPITLREARVRFRAGAAGLTRGVLAGRLDFRELSAAFGGSGGGAFIDDPMPGAGDLDADVTGRCRSISVALVFDAVPASASVATR